RTALGRVAVVRPFGRSAHPARWAPPPMNLRRAWTPATTRTLQLALALLVVVYMLRIGGSFGAIIFFPVQRLNLLAGAGLALAWLLMRLVQRRPLALTGLEVP